MTPRMAVMCHDYSATNVPIRYDPVHGSDVSQLQRSDYCVKITVQRLLCKSHSALCGKGPTFPHCGLIVATQAMW